MKWSAHEAKHRKRGESRSVAHAPTQGRPAVAYLPVSRSRWGSQLRADPLLLLLLLTPSLIGWSWGLAWWKTRQGNQLFAQAEKLERDKKQNEATKKYKEALQKYRDALLDDPTAPGIPLNIGSVYYKQRKYEEAVKEFEKVLQSDDAALQAKAHYNIGNCHFRKNDLLKSIESYKRALELDPDDQDAKYNLELARQKLKDQANKQQNQQDQQQQQQQQQNQRQSKADSKSGKQKGKDKNGADQQSQESKAKQGKGAKAKQDTSKGKQGAKAKAMKMSKEEAERLLRSLEDEEKQAMRESMRTPVPDNPDYSGKDY